MEKKTPNLIVVFLDGTSNDSNQTDFDWNITNVYKLFHDIEGDVDRDANENPGVDLQTNDVQGKQFKQMALYVWGVGAKEDYFLQLWRQLVASDFEERLLRGYQFIAREYKAGDEIVLVGYSRGGFTARALADCICTMGVPNTTTDGFAAECSRNWSAYKRIPVNDRRTRQPEKPEDRVKIKAVCAFDVVAGPGLDTSFVINGIHQNIGKVYHAVARDEKRWLFEPTLWPVDNDGKLVQMLFPGSHADVGGGYKDGFHSDASDVALNWMKKNMIDLGVIFAVGLPGDRDDAAQPVIHRPWNTFPYKWLWQTPRPRDACVDHVSVSERQNAGGPEADTDVAERIDDILTVSYT